jgi:hypothetical protein
MQSLIINIPGQATRLFQDGERVFRIAAGFIAEATALKIDLEATFRDKSIGDQNGVGCGYLGMRLEGVHESGGGA